MTGNDHALEDADLLELAEIKQRWEPYINQLPDYAYLCDELLAAEWIKRRVSGSHGGASWHLLWIFVNLIKKSLTICLGKDSQKHFDFLRCAPAVFDIAENCELTAAMNWNSIRWATRRRRCSSL